MESAEVFLGVLVVRIGLSLAALGWCLWLTLRTGKPRLPADLQATLASLRHQVLELDESLRMHMNKHNARTKREEPLPPMVPPQGPPADLSGYSKGQIRDLVRRSHEVTKGA